MASSTDGNAQGRADSKGVQGLHPVKVLLQPLGETALQVCQPGAGLQLLDTGKAQGSHSQLMSTQRKWASWRQPSGYVDGQAHGCAEQVGSEQEAWSPRCVSWEGHDFKRTTRDQSRGKRAPGGLELSVLC